MRKKFLKRGLYLALSLTMLTAIPLAVYGETDQNQSEGFYHVSGTKILDGDDNEVVLKGMSFGNSIFSEPTTISGAEDFGTPDKDHTAESYQELADMGLDHVRFELNYHMFESDDDPAVTSNGDGTFTTDAAKYRSAGFEWIDQNIQWAKEAGIKLILQMKYPQGGYQASTSVMIDGTEDVGNGGKGLWIDIDEKGNVVADGENYKLNQARLIALWKEIAVHYADEPTVIGYGLINEPVVPQVKVDGIADKDATLEQLKDLDQRIADAIRSVDDNHMLFVECLLSWFDPDDYNSTDWNLMSIPETQFTIDDQNAVYEFHFYEPFIFTHQGADWMWQYTDTTSIYPSGTVIEMEIGDWSSRGLTTAAKDGTDGEWTYFVSESFSAKSENNANTDYNCAQPQVSAAGLAAGESIWFDDIVITRTDGEGNTTILQTYDFTDDLGSFINLWLNNGDNVSTLTWDDSTGHTANGSMKITNNSSSAASAWANANSWDNFYLEPDCTYRISGWVKSRNDNHYPQVSYLYADQVWVENRDYVEYMLDVYTAFGKENNVPQHVGEWGFHYNCYDKGAEQYVRDLAELFEEYGLSSNYHSYHDATFGLYLAEEHIRPSKGENGNFNQTLYDLLVTYYCTPRPSNDDDVPARPDKAVSDIFTDVAKGQWYVDAIQYVYDRGIMEGNDTTFTPNGKMTRAMFVLTLYRLEGEPEITDYQACEELNDVSDSAWYTNAVCWAYNTKVTTGYLDDMTFRMNEPLTREQLATFLYRYAQYKGLDVSQSDDLSELLNADKVKAYAKDAVQWAVGTGLITGQESKDENGAAVYDLAPQGTATRAQLASILARFDEAYNR